MAHALIVAALAIVAWFIRDDRHERMRFKALTDTAARQRRYRMWIAEAFAIFLLSSLGGLAPRGRLDTLTAPPPEFADAVERVPHPPAADVGRLAGLMVGAMFGGSVLGVVLGAIYLATGSLWIAVAAHVLIDLNALVLRDHDHVFLKGHRIMVQAQSSWFPVMRQALFRTLSRKGRERAKSRYA